MLAVILVLDFLLGCKQSLHNTAAHDNASRCKVWLPLILLQVGDLYIYIYKFIQTLYYYYTGKQRKILYFSPELMPTTVPLAIIL